MLGLYLNGNAAPTTFAVGAVYNLVVLADGSPVLESAWSISTDGVIVAQGVGSIALNLGQPGGYFVNVSAVDQFGNDQEALFPVTITYGATAASAVAVVWNQYLYNAGDTVQASLIFRSANGARMTSLAWSLFRNETLAQVGTGTLVTHGSAGYGVYRISATAVDENGNTASANSTVVVSGGFELLSAVVPVQPPATLRYLGALYSVAVSGGPVQCTVLPFTLTSVTQEFLLLPGTTHFSFDIDPTLNNVDDEVVVRTNLGNWALVGPPSGLSGQPFAYDYQTSPVYLPAPADLKVWATMEGVNAHGGVVSSFNFRVRLKCYRIGAPVYQYTACPYSTFTGGAGVRERRLVALFTQLDVDTDVGGSNRLGVPGGVQSFTLPSQQRLLCSLGTGGSSASVPPLPASINYRFQSQTLQFLNTDTGAWNTVYAAGADPYPTYALYPSSTPGPVPDSTIAPVGVNYRFQGATLQLFNQDTLNYNTVNTDYDGSVLVLALSPSSTPAMNPDPTVALLGLNYAIAGGYLLFQNVSDGSYDYASTVGLDPYPDFEVHEFTGQSPTETDFISSTAPPGLVTATGISATEANVVSTYEPVAASLSEIDVHAVYGIAGARPASLNFTQTGLPRSLQKVKRAYGRLAVFVADGFFNAGSSVQVSVYTGHIPGAVNFTVPVLNDVYSPDKGTYVWIGDAPVSYSDFEFGHTGLLEDFSVTELASSLASQNYRFCASTFQLYNPSTQNWNSVYSYGADPWPQVVVMPSSTPGPVDAIINPSGVNYRFCGHTFQLLNQTTGFYNTVNGAGIGSFPEIAVQSSSTPGSGVDASVGLAGANYAFLNGIFAWVNLTTGQNNFAYTFGFDPYPTIELQLASGVVAGAYLPTAAIAPSTINAQASAPNISVDGACYTSPTLVQPLLDGFVYQSFGTTAGCGDVACGPVGLYCYTSVSGTGSIQAQQPLYYPSPYVSSPSNQGFCYTNPVLIQEVTANGTQTPVNRYANASACGTGYLYTACSGTVTPLAVIYPTATSPHSVVSYGTLCWSLSGSISDLRPYSVTTANLTTPVSGCLDVVCTGSNSSGPSVAYSDIETGAQVNVQFPVNGASYSAQWGAASQKTDSGIGTVLPSEVQFIVSPLQKCYLSAFQEPAIISVTTSHQKFYKRLVIVRGGSAVNFDLFAGMNQLQIQVLAGDVFYADFTQAAQRSAHSGVGMVSWQRVVVLPRVYDTVTVAAPGSPNVVQALGFCALSNRSPYILYSPLPADSRQGFPNPDTFVTVSGTAASETILIRSRAVGDAAGETLPFPWYAGQAIAGPLTFNFYASRSDEGSHGEMDVWLSGAGAPSWPAILKVSAYKALQLNPAGGRRSAAPSDTSRNSVQVVNSAAYGSPRVFASAAGETISVNTSGSAATSAQHNGQTFLFSGTVDYGVSAVVF